MNWRRSALSGVFVVLLITVAVSGGTAQPDDADQPEWSDTLFERLDDAVAEYNARDYDANFIERRLSRNARINLYVSDDSGATAVYSLRLDRELKVIDVDRGPLDDPTIRAEATKATVEVVSNADDPKQAVRGAIWDRQIRIERVIELFDGVRLLIGVVDVLIGAGAVTVVSMTIAKVGVSSTVSSLQGVGRWIARAFQRVVAYFRNMSPEAIVTKLTVLKMLGLLEPIKRAVGRLWGTLRGAIDSVVDPLSGSATEKDGDDERD